MRKSSLHGPHEVRWSSSARAPQQCKMGFPVGRGPEIHVGGDLETCRGSLEKDTEASCPTIKRCEFLEVVGLPLVDGSIRAPARGFNGGIKSRRPRTCSTTVDCTACGLYELGFKGLLLQNASSLFQQVLLAPFLLLNMSVRISARLPWQKSGVCFQILSDLHLELGQQYSHFHIPASAPYLILAGDIGNLCHYQSYLDFLRRQCDNFRQVFLVLGNHEFYGISRNEGLRLAALLEQEAALQGKLKILNRTRADISSDVVILGCTLQSCISPSSRAVIECKVKDFKRIQQWTVDDHNAEHSRDVAWLKQQISAIKKGDMEKGHRFRRILVVTHHAPIRQGASKPEHENTPWSGAFGTDLRDVVDNESSSLLDVEGRVFGHTHYTTQYCARHGKAHQ